MCVCSSVVKFTVEIYHYNGRSTSQGPLYRQMPRHATDCRLIVWSCTPKPAPSNNFMLRSALWRGIGTVMDPWVDRTEVGALEMHLFIAVCLIRFSTVCNLRNNFLKKKRCIYTAWSGSTCFSVKSVGPLKEDFCLDFIQIIYKQLFPSS